MVIRDKHHILAFAGDRVITDREEAMTKEEVDREVQKVFESGPAGVRVLVDGQSQTVPAKVARPAPPPRADSETGVALAHHMLWQGYERAAQTQAFLLDRMNAAAIDMNRRYFEELQKMRADYHAKMDTLDAVALETRMYEREAAFRRMAEHQRALNRAPEEPWYVQLARGVAHLSTVLGDDLIEPAPPKGGRRE